ncbi:uncharacterized protein L3040_006646 [Drepanopeziza brunnea f. sp. 'multigermtubi']|uniref:Subtilase n=1 Tax=Marssonina brunnea f. sp. multigermtubi (strain MB_m1) TaxID=1072389 RepID=K1WWS1_MARBU|nr:subtilase [Drepanopeziza brunnea f. sp. 'multigermtubi' MB_m1]EKD17531.1 subtilase [Drepanopeziza brunnea f. sp. 'multigermtubi' MB_m1]KAJ5038973.1 hypothetical protein L3040_006646 [Drepanopeziza brunnea f. sp. 'multigermtubi']
MFSRPSLLRCLALWLTGSTLVQSAPAPHTGGPALNGIGVPIHNPEAKNIVANRYIVVYNDDCSDEMVEEHQLHMSVALKKRNLNKRALDGRMMSTSIAPFAMQGWRGTCLDADDEMMLDIASMKGVKYIEADTVVKIDALVSQPAAPDALSRISHANPGGSGYVFDNSAGAGITVYVVDTGILTSHQEYAGRASWGANFVNDIDEDENGHGTHVAGSVGGATFGVAKQAQLVAVKTLDAEGAGTNSGVLAGLNFVETDVTARGLGGKAIMNMSIGGSKSAALNAAVEALTRAGVTVVVAAGNEGQDSANVSPASSPSAITVGAIDETDTIAEFSNFGPYVDIFAPGVQVQSAGIRGDSSTQVLSGTSMACPHIAGLAAYLMNLENLEAPEDVKARIKQLAASTGAAVKGANQETTTLIAYNGDGF